MTKATRRGKIRNLAVEITLMEEMDLRRLYRGRRTIVMKITRREKTVKPTKSFKDRVQ